MFAHRGDHVERPARRVPVGVDDFARAVELENAADIQIAEQPVGRRHRARHPAPEPRIAHHQIHHRVAHAGERDPVSAVGGPVDVVGIAGKGAEKRARPGGQVLEVEDQERAGPGARDQDVLALMGEADAVREHQIVAYRAGPASFRIVAQEAPVRPALEQIESPVFDVVALRRVGKIDHAVRRDIDVVRHPDCGVVLDAEKAALGLVGQEFHLPPLIDAHKTHPRDADDDASLPIQRKAERPAADLREGLDMAVVGAGDPDEAPVPGAAKEIVVRIEDHVLRAVDQAGGEKVGAYELRGDLIGHKPGCSGRLANPGGDRIDIGRSLEPMLVLAELGVGGKDEENDGAHRKLDEIAAQARVEEGVVENVDRGEADHHRDGRAPAGHETAEAHDQSGQGEELHADAGVGGDGVLARRVQEAREADDQACENVGEENRPPYPDAAMPRRLAVSPGRQHVPPEARLAKHHENAGRHDKERPEADGNGQEPLGPDPVPDVVAPGARGDRDKLALRRERVDPADRDRRSERGQERPAAGESGQRPVDDADRRAGHEARAEHGDDRQVQDVEAIERDERRHGEIGADREVDASSGDNDE